MARSALVRTAVTRPVATGRGRAHGKAILFGEHAVVYGSPAIALPVRGLATTAWAQPHGDGIRIASALYSGAAETAPEHLRPVVTAVEEAQRRLDTGRRGLHIRICSSIPPERGLGSSAAVAAAVARAVASLGGRKLDAQLCHEIVQASERIAHGTPSGLDATTVCSAHPVLFRKGVATRLQVGGGMTFVIADSGVPGATSEAIADVRKRHSSDPEGIDAAFAAIASGAERAAVAIADGDIETIGDAMSDAHRQLHRIGVSTRGLDELCRAAEHAGALGAKLTGGGLGGCVIALVDSPTRAAHVAAALDRAGATRTWTLTEGPA